MKAEQKRLSRMVGKVLTEKKIILVNPFVDYSHIGHIDKLYPPLSLLYTSTLLKRLGFEDTSLIDADTKKIRPDSAFWGNLNAHIFIISTASLHRWQCPPIDFSFLSFKDVLRKKNPDSYFFFIGPHTPQKHLQKEFFIQANPEVRLCNLITNLILKRKGEIEPKITNLPLPDYSLVKKKDYSFPLFRGKFFLIESSRGCPHNCSFCNKTMHPKYEKKALSQIKKELLSLHKSGIRNLGFIDLDFLADKKFALEICSLLSGFSPRFRYFIQTRCDNVEDGILKELSDSGCDLIQLGVETFSRKTLTRMNKRQEPSSITNAFDLCKKHRIKTLAYMMAGFPGQTDKQFRDDTIQIKKLDPDYISCVPYVDYLHNKAIGIKKARSMNLNFYLRPYWIIKTLRSGNALGLFALLRSFITYLISRQ